MNSVKLSDEYAIVLQQVEEAGGEDFGTLADVLRFDRQRLAHIVAALRNKGLIVLNRDGHNDMWIRVSSKGHRLIQYIWPETTQLHTAR